MSEKNKLNQFDRSAAAVQPGQGRKGAGGRIPDLVALEEDNGEVCAFLPRLLAAHDLIDQFAATVNAVRAAEEGNQ